MHACGEGTIHLHPQSWYSRSVGGWGNTTELSAVARAIRAAAHATTTADPLPAAPAAPPNMPAGPPDAVAPPAPPGDARPARGAAAPAAPPNMPAGPPDTVAPPAPPGNPRPARGAAAPAITRSREDRSQDHADRHAAAPVAPPNMSAIKKNHARIDHKITQTATPPHPPRRPTCLVLARLMPCTRPPRLATRALPERRRRACRAAQHACWPA